MSFPIEGEHLPPTAVTSFILRGGTLADSIRATLSRNLPLTLVQHILIGNDEQTIIDLEREFDMPTTGRLDFFVTNYPFYCYTDKWRHYHTPENCVSLMIADGRLDELKDQEDSIKQYSVRTQRIIIAARRGYHDVLEYLLVKNPSCDIRIVEGYAMVNNMEMVQKLATTNRRVWQILTGAACGGHIELFEAYRPIYLGDISFNSLGVCVSSIVEWALRYKRIAMVEYLMKKYELRPKLSRFDCKSWISSAFKSGDRNTIDYTLQLTGIRVGPKYLKHIAAGDNLQIIKGYREKFGEKAFATRLKAMVHEAMNYRKHNIVWYLVTTTKYNEWDLLLSRAVEISSIPLIRLCLEKGATNVDESLATAKNYDRIAIVRVLEDFQRRL